MRFTKLFILFVTIFAAQASFGKEFFCYDASNRYVGSVSFDIEGAWKSYNELADEGRQFDQSLKTAEDKPYTGSYFFDVSPAVPFDTWKRLGRPARSTLLRQGAAIEKGLIDACNHVLAVNGVVPSKVYKIRTSYYDWNGYLTYPVVMTDYKENTVFRLGSKSGYKSTFAKVRKLDAERELALEYEALKMGQE